MRQPRALQDGRGEIARGIGSSVDGCRSSRKKLARLKGAGVVPPPLPPEDEAASLADRILARNELVVKLSWLRSLESSMTT